MSKNSYKQTERKRKPETVSDYKQVISKVKIKGKKVELKDRLELHDNFCPLVR